MSDENDIKGQLALTYIWCENSVKLLRKHLDSLYTFKDEQPDHSDLINNALDKCYEQLFETLAILEIKKEE